MGVSFFIERYPQSVDEENTISMSCSTARAVFEAIGFELPDGAVGEIRGRDLSVRCLRYIASPRVDRGTLGSVSGGEGRALFVDCGRPAGFVTRRINDLLALAEVAGELGMIRFA